MQSKTKERIKQQSEMTEQDYMDLKTRLFVASVPYRKVAAEVGVHVNTVTNCLNGTNVAQDTFRKIYKAIQKLTK